MPNQYLLESGSPDGYLLEDDSGVLLLDYDAGAQGAAAGNGQLRARKPTQGLLAAGASRTHPRYRGCVGHWWMGEGGGLVAFDISGYKNNGTLTGTPAWAGGIFGPALTLNGSTDYIELGNPTQLQITGSLSIGAWVRATSFPNADDNYIVTKSGASANVAYKLTATIDNAVEQFYMGVSSDGATTIRRYTAVTIAANIWYHVCGVFNAVAQTLDIYVNGALSNGTLAGAVPATISNSSDTALLGKINGATNRNWAGLIDEVRIYNRALYDSEIKSLYTDPFLEFRPVRRPFAFTVPAAPTGPPAGSLALLGVGR